MSAARPETIVKALPSRYADCEFRSRLEARWAALFDLYDIEWIYEPEGFETPSVNYLPDFYLPGLRCYVEVKPGPKLFDQVAVEAIARAQDCDFLILDSPTVECRYYPLYSRKSGGWEWIDMSWCGSIAYLKSRRNGEYRFFVCCGIFHDHGMMVSEPCGSCFSGLRDEFKLARNLRFENGVAE